MLANFNWMKKMIVYAFFRFGWWANGNWQWSRQPRANFCEASAATLRYGRREIYRSDWIMVSWQLPPTVRFNWIDYVNFVNKEFFYFRKKKTFDLWAKILCVWFIAYQDCGSNWKCVLINRLNNNKIWWMRCKNGA